MDMSAHSSWSSENSENEDDGSWRGSRQESSQSSASLSGFPVMNSAEEISDDDEQEDSHQFDEEGLTIKEESSENSVDIDVHVYSQVSSIDGSPDVVRQVPNQVKPETMSFVEGPTISKQIQDSPEICRNASPHNFALDLSKPQVPSPKRECIELKYQSQESVQNMSFYEESFLHLDNQDLNLSFEFLNTSEPFPDLHISIDSYRSGRSEKNGASSDDTESSSEEDRDVFDPFPDIGDWTKQSGTTQAFEELSLMMTSMFVVEADGDGTQVVDNELMSQVLDTDDPFMDISTQSQVVDCHEELSNQSVNLPLIATDQMELMDISSRNNSFVNQMTITENSIIFEDHSTATEDEDLANICRRKNLRKEDRACDSIENLLECLDGLENDEGGFQVDEMLDHSGDGEMGDFEENEEETKASHAALSRCNTIEDQFLAHDDDDKSSDYDLREALPLAESTGINISEWIQDGLKRGWEHSEDDVEVERAIKVRRVDKSIEENSNEVLSDESASLGGNDIYPVTHNSSSALSANLHDSSSECFSGRQFKPSATSPLCNTSSNQLPLHPPSTHQSFHKKQTAPSTASRPAKTPTRVDSLGIGILADLKEPETSSGISTGSPPTPPSPECPTMEAPKKPANSENDSDSDLETYRKKRSTNKCISESSDNSSTTPIRDDYVHRKKSRLTMKSYVKTVKCPKASSVPNSQNTLKRAQNSLLKFEKSSPILAKGSVPEKRKKSHVVDSSDEENNAPINRPPKTLKKKRKLFSLSGSIEVPTKLYDSRENNRLSESRSKLLRSSDEFDKSRSRFTISEIVKNARVTPAEYYKTVVVSPSINDSVSGGSYSVKYSERTNGRHSELDVSIGRRQAAQVPPSHLLASSTSNVSRDILGHPEEMEMSGGASQEVQKSGVDMDISGKDSPEMDDDAMVLTPTQLSKCFSCSYKSSKPPDKIVSVELGNSKGKNDEVERRTWSPAEHIPSKSSDIHSIYRAEFSDRCDASVKLSGSPDPEHSNRIERKFCNGKTRHPERLRPYPDSENIPRVFEDKQIPEMVSLDSPKKPLPLPELIEISDGDEGSEKSSHESSPSEKSETRIARFGSHPSRVKTQEHLDVDIHILRIISPLVASIPVYTLTDDEEETEVPAESSKPFSKSNPEIPRTIPISAIPPKLYQQKVSIFRTGK